jgi:ABC-2 type transport system permease protein
MTTTSLTPGFVQPLVRTSRPRLLRAELRKLLTTRMPLVFILALVAIATLNGFIVALGTEMDGSKSFIATAADQQSLVAFAANALLGAGLFGAVAAAREYGHKTVVPMYLTTPRRSRAVVAQFSAIAILGAALSVLGAAMVVLAMALALPTTEFGFLMSAGGVTRVLAAAGFAGAIGSLIGAGIGVLVRNTGGAVASSVLVLFIAPPLVMQMASETSEWMPSNLAHALSGVLDGPSVPATVLAMLAWALVPAALGVWAIRRRDVA